MKSKLTVAGTAAVAVVAASLSAQAADLGVKRPVYTPAPPPVPVFTWTGFYFGGNIGGKWATNSSEDVTIGPVAGPVPGFPNGIPASTVSFSGGNASSFMGGGQVGYNWQTGPWVWGLEGDIDAQNLKRDQVVDGLVVSGTNFVPGDFFTLKSKWEASFRGRIGYAWDRFMLYATGGVAWTHVKAEANFGAAPCQLDGAPTIICPAAFAEESKTFTGGTVGGGFEWAPWQNWAGVTIGVEGRYTWYGTKDFDTGTVAVLGTGNPANPNLVFAPVTHSIKLNTAEVMGKINFKFGPWSY
jgi:outer membrane immunogenic protein